MRLRKVSCSRNCATVKFEASCDDLGQRQRRQPVAVALDARLRPGRGRGRPDAARSARWPRPAPRREHLPRRTSCRWGRRSMPVIVPMRKVTSWPKRWNWRSLSIGTRWPRWRSVEGRVEAAIDAQRPALGSAAARSSSSIVRWMCGSPYSTPRISSAHLLFNRCLSRHAFLCP